MNSKKLLNDVLQSLLIVSAVVVAAPHFAFALAAAAAASGGDLSSSVDNLANNELTNIPDLINICFYIAGAAFCGSGLLKLKMYAENPQNAPLGQGIGRVSVGAGLLALPYLASALTATFGMGATAATFVKFASVS